MMSFGGFDMNGNETYKNSPSIINIILIGVISIVVIAYGAIALNTGDLLWFWPKFDSKPEQIVLHCYGENMIVDPFSQGFNEITKLVNQTLSSSKRWDPLSLSDATYQDYQSHPKMLTLELYYPEAVRVHSNTIYFSNVDNLIIPLDGRHATKQAIFGRTIEGNPAAGSLIVETTSTIKSYLAGKGLCESPEVSY